MSTYDDWLDSGDPANDLDPRESEAFEHACEKAFGTPSIVLDVLCSLLEDAQETEKTFPCGAISTKEEPFDGSELTVGAAFILLLNAPGEDVRREAQQRLRDFIEGGLQSKAEELMRKELS